MGKTIRYVLLAVIAIAASGCVPEIPKEVLSNVDTTITFKMLKINPTEYTGKTIITGGEIVSATNQSNGDTALEIIEFPLDSDYKPQKSDQSSGRFIVSYKGYLETKIFAPGRLVTIVGTVGESHKGTIGSMPYTFPLVSSTYVKLWPIKPNPVPVYSLGFGLDYAPYMAPPWWYYPYGPLMY